MKLEVGKTYIDQHGHTIELVHYTGLGNYPWTGVFNGDVTVLIGINGGVKDSTKQIMAEYNQYLNWPIDCKIKVRDGTSQVWTNVHFAGVSQKGLVLAFQYGGTSWTCAKSCTDVWIYAERVI